MEEIMKIAGRREKVIFIIGFLGHFSIFVVPLPLVTLAIVILVAKSCIDEDYRSVPGQCGEIIHSLAGGDFNHVASLRMLITFFRA